MIATDLKIDGFDSFATSAPLSLSAVRTRDYWKRRQRRNKVRDSLLPHMTEWNAAEYYRRSSLQEAMAQEVLALLDIKGSERILDVGCGDGKITAQIASRAP